MDTYFTRLFYALILLLSVNLNAQNQEDALRYSMDEVSGSARFTGMSGAFSSLGGDMSAVGLNPAGLTTFSTNRISGNFSFYNNANKTNLLNNHSLSDYTSFDDNIINIDQLGVALVYKSDVSDWNKVALGFNYNKSADYGDNYLIKANSSNSVTNYFVNQAQGVYLQDIKVAIDETTDGVYKWLGENIGFNSQQAFLAYQAYVINPVDPNDDNNVAYTPNAVFTQLNHINKINSTGNKSNIDFTIAGTYKKKLQLGFTLAFQNIDFSEHNSIAETGYDATSDLQHLKFANTLRVEGSGVQLKFGGIYKLNQKFRLSFAFHSPQWIKIEEFLKQSISTEFSNGDKIDITPDIENSFAPYRVITPSKMILGASYVVGKTGLISADYTYQNYANLHFKEIEKDADTDYFDGINEYMNNNFKAVHQINFGGELRLKDIHLRAGTYLRTSPYKNNTKLYAQTGYSTGLGFDFGGVVLDFAWMHSVNQTNKTLLTLPEISTINQNKNKFLLGFRYDF